MSDFLNSCKHYASVGSFQGRMALQRQLEYPLFLVSWLIMIPLKYLIGVWMLKILVDQFQPLAGWTFPQLAFLYGLGMLSHGLMVVVSIQSWFLDHMVIQGGFDRMLLRPLNVFFQFTFMYLNLIGCVDLIPAVIIFVTGCSLTGFDWTFGNSVGVLSVVLGATLIRSSFYTLTACVAFWTKRATHMRAIGHDLMERSTLYPLSIYPKAFQWILTFVIPLGFISFYPSTALLNINHGTALPLEIAMWTPIIGIAMFGLSQIVFNRGLRAYESAGS